MCLPSCAPTHATGTFKVPITIVGKSKNPGASAAEAPLSNLSRRRVRGLIARCGQQVCKDLRPPRAPSLTSFAGALSWPLKTLTNLTPYFDFVSIFTPSRAFQMMGEGRHATSGNAGRARGRVGERPATRFQGCGGGQARGGAQHAFGRITRISRDPLLTRILFIVGKPARFAGLACQRRRR